MVCTNVCVPNATVVERCTVDPSDQSGILSSTRSRFGYITTILFLVSPLYLLYRAILNSRKLLLLHCEYFWHKSIRVYQKKRNEIQTVHVPLSINPYSLFSVHTKYINAAMHKANNEAMCRNANSVSCCNRPLPCSLYFVTLYSVDKMS